MEDKNWILIGAGVAAVVLAALAAKKAAGAVVDTAKDALNAVNPLNNDNVINRGFTDVYKAVTGSDGSLGGDIYDITHPTYGSDGNVVVNAPGQPGYDKTKTATDIYGNPDRVAGWMESVTSFIWGDAK